MKSTADKREREKRMVSEMIALYCRKKHHTKGRLCPECADLEAYARMRSDKCPFMETKPSVPTVRYIATNRSCGRKSGKSCVFPGPECCFPIL